MNDPNPYEAPRSKLSAEPTLRPLTVKEQAMARRMLEARARGGYTIGLFYRWSVARYLVILAYFGVVLGLLALLELWPLFLLMFGLLAGVLLRDLGWARATVTTWPLTERVTDWAAVQRVADGGLEPT